MEKIKKCPKWIIRLTLNKQNKKCIILNIFFVIFCYSIFSATAIDYVKCSHVYAVTKRTLRDILVFISEKL